MAKHRIPESERYRGPLKWLVYILARALISVLQRVPVRVAYCLGRGIGWASWKLLKSRRAIVRKNLVIINAWLESKPGSTAHDHSQLGTIDEQVKEVFLRSGANLFCGFTFARMNLETVSKYIEVGGIEQLKAGLAQGRGAMILLAHMGPWEALTHLPVLARDSEIHAPLAAMYRPLNNRYLDDWFKGKREATGTRLFSRRDGFHKPVDFLRSGGILGVLADQKLKRGEQVPFFGQLAKTNPMPGLMQRRSKCATFRLSLVTLEPCRWRLEVEAVDFSEDRVERSRSSETTLCNEALEASLSKSILDGFWFHDRF